MSISSSAAGDKYSRLASEYATAKVQLSVLKKAVHEQKAKYSELEASCKSKDQSLRQLTQEVEALTFRNQQLSKRVQQLQSTEEPSRRDSDVGRKVSHDSLGSSKFIVLSEELSNKVKEIEELHIKISDIESTQKEEMTHRQVEIDHLASQNRQLLAQLDEIRVSYSKSLQTVEKEKQQLTLTLAALNEEISRLKSDLSVRRDSSHALIACDIADEKDLSIRAPLEIACPNNVISTSDLPRASDTVFVSSHLASNVQDTLIAQALESFWIATSSVITCLQNFDAYCEQRAKAYISDLSHGATFDSLKTYVQVLQGGSEILKTVSTDCERLFYLDSSNTTRWWEVKDVNALQSSCKLYAGYIRELVRTTANSIEEECVQSWCEERLEKQNLSFYNCVKQFYTALIRLCDCCRSSSDSENLADLSTVSGRYDEFIHCVGVLSSTATDCFTHYQAKTALENQMPMATKQLRASNECIVASLHSLPAQIDNMQECLRRHKQLLCKKFAEVGQNAVNSQDKASACFLNRVMTEILRKDDQFAALEKEKEHWMLECQLVRLKCSQFHSIVAEEDKLDLNDIARIIEEFFLEKLTHLRQNLQIADSKLLFLQEECSNLICVVQTCTKNMDELSAELRRARIDLVSVKDELSSTKVSYETQLSSMSELLANMNLRITAQSEELESVKHSQNDSSKNTKTTGSKKKRDL